MEQFLVILYLPSDRTLDYQGLFSLQTRGLTQNINFLLLDGHSIIYSVHLTIINLLLVFVYTYLIDDGLIIFAIYSC